MERARRFCGAKDRAFAVTRSQIGGRDYTIAFTCPRPDPQPALPSLVAEPAPLPALPPLDAPAATARGRGGFPAGTETF
ncbi:hypothetical protein [Falsiroseomonas selenitidurans]|uniref:Uncharacterized protein n=1 Tax=Falsiroseomonas selenitidurans TaxID=2716335 RepID=A0ABX1E0F9_9PROT|nr:hypothetical protein [Falsiroseomonas selenitidurans]NKC30639.1 hypothetical protein [Falsiroseomonas selenitidurans]